MITKVVIVSERDCQSNITIMVISIATHCQDNSTCERSAIYKF